MILNTSRSSLHKQQKSRGGLSKTQTLFGVLYALTGHNQEGAMFAHHIHTVQDTT